MEAVDEDSIEEHGGGRTYPVPSQFISSVEEAQAYALFLLALLKDQHTRAEVSFDATTYLTTAISLDLSDRVTLEIAGQEEDMFVEAINHQHPRGNRQRMTLLLSSAAAYGQVIVLDRGPGLGVGILSV